MFTHLLRDLKYAFRSFARRPGFTAVLVVTLALGIGSVVAIFSVAHAVLFSPLPYGHPEELALVWTRLPATNVERSLVSGPDLQDYASETSLFEGFAGAVALSGAITGDGPPEQVTTAYTTWNLFDVLEVEAAVGRTFEAEDAFPVDPESFGVPNPDLPPGKVMLTHGLWQRRFGGDPSVVGRTIQMDGWGSVVVGVLPADFKIHLPADMAMPTDIDAWGVLPSNIGEFARDAAWLTVVTRVKEGVTMEQAQREMDALATRLREIHPFHATQDLRIHVAGLHGEVVRHARPGLLALLGAVAFVLLIACANVANLLLVRATGRGREIAVRGALGSGRGRIVAQMLTESAVLGFAGALVGVGLAWYGVRVITELSPGNLPRIDAVSLDGPVLVFTAAVTLLATAVFGLAPAHRTVSGNLADALKDRGADAGGVRGNKLRTGLAVAEVALSLVLLVGAGLMLRSFAEVRKVDPGFETENVVTFSAPLQFLKYYNPALRSNFGIELAERLRSIPGVEGVGGVAPLPLAGGEQYSVGSYGRVGDPDHVYQANKADYKTVLPGYFEVLDIEIVAGRALVDADNRVEALPVAVIDRKLAARAFGGDDPLGRELLIDYFNEETFSMERRAVQIVGVAADVRSTSLAAESRETLYVPHILLSFLPVTYVVKTATDPANIMLSIRREVAAVDPDVPISAVATLQSYVDGSMTETRFLLALIGTFAAVALVLASLGLYGVISYSARQRTREIGVRVAFGADHNHILRLIVGQGMLLAAAGVALGLAASVPLTRVAESLLIGVSPTDPATYAGVPAVLLAVALIASWVPARRATAVDPVVALRDE